MNLNYVNYLTLFKDKIDINIIMNSMMQTYQPNGNASLIIDGGHFEIVKSKLINRKIAEHRENKRFIFLDLGALLEKLEYLLNVKFYDNQKLFFQGTLDAVRNNAHKTYEDRYGIQVFIHDLKTQTGQNAPNPYTKSDIPKETTPVQPIVEQATVSDPPYSSSFAKIGARIMNLICPNREDQEEPIALAVEPVVEDPELYNKKSRIRVERGVDVHIAVKSMECAYGLRGMHKSSTVVFITGDSDLEEALKSANAVSNVIVISQKGALANKIKHYATPSIDLESLIKEFIKDDTNHYYYREELNQQRQPQQPIHYSNNVNNYSGNSNNNYNSNSNNNSNYNNNNSNNYSNNNYRIAPPLTVTPPSPPPPPQQPQVKNNFAVAKKIAKQVEKEVQMQAPVSVKHTEAKKGNDKSTEVALLLHRYIATKWNANGKKDFHATDAVKFYQGVGISDLLKKHVKSVGIQTICEQFPELFTTRHVRDKVVVIDIAKTDGSRILMDRYSDEQEEAFAQSVTKPVMNHETYRETYHSEANPEALTIAPSLPIAPALDITFSLNNESLLDIACSTGIEENPNDLYNLGIDAILELADELNVEGATTVESVIEQIRNKLTEGTDDDYIEDNL